MENRWQEYNNKLNQVCFVYLEFALNILIGELTHLQRTEYLTMTMFINNNRKKRI